MPFIGRIYRIDFPDGYFYIGSTKKSLLSRLAQHKYTKVNDVKGKINGNYTLRIRFDLYVNKYGWNNPTITLIEECHVASLKELHEREKIHVYEHYNHIKNLNTRYWSPKLALPVDVITSSDELCTLAAWGRPSLAVDRSHSTSL